MQKDNLIETVPDIWQYWNENGIDTNAEISLIFTFYSAFDKESSSFVQKLLAQGYQTEKKSKRTMIFFKGYVITAEKSRRWTQEELKVTIGELESLARQNETILEGYFAASI